MTLENEIKNMKGRIREAIYEGKTVAVSFSNEVRGCLLCDTEYFKCTYNLTTLYIFCYPVVDSDGVIDTEYDNSVVAVELIKYFKRLVDYIKTPRR